MPSTRRATKGTTSRPKPDPNEALRREFMKLPNVGRATAGDLLLLGIKSVAELKTIDAWKLYDRLCEVTKQRHDPCCIDVFMAIKDFARTGVERPWWDFTPIRKLEQSRRESVKLPRVRGS